MGYSPMKAKKNMTDAEFKYMKNGTTVLMTTEVYADGVYYILAVLTNVQQTRDSFKNFKEAFDSFSGIVKTLETEVELCN